MNWHSIYFLLFAIAACGFAVAVVLTSNIVRMAFYLVLSLGATAGLFFLAGSDFIGAMQLLIYVGGTLVLLIFGVMLTAQSPFVSMKPRPGDWWLAAIVGGSLLALLVQAAVSLPEWQGGPRVSATSVAPTPTATVVGEALLGVRVDALSQADSTLQTDTAGLSGYLLPFEIVSVHLLVVLIGAAYLARAKRRTRHSDGDVQELTWRP
jgi:NADH:ubiquinone oxidoreductase subunit 6 (subunit J)